MKRGSPCLRYGYSLHGFWAILTQVLALKFAPALFAESSAWTVLGIQDTGFHRNGQVLATLSPSEEIYSAGPGISGSCPPPTLTVGDPSRTSSCVTKANASGHQVFSVQIGGATSLDTLALDPAGNAYITGAAGLNGAGFATTPGAYEPSPTAGSNQFVCKLSGTDGHPLFCTFVDLSFDLSGNSASLTVDSAGNTYIKGGCVPDSNYACVEKLNPTGTAVGYLTNIGPGVPPHIAVDANGNLFAQWRVGITKLGPSGAVIATAAAPNALAGTMALDPAGEPEVALQGAFGSFLLRRYTSDLATILFETPLFVPGSTVSGMSTDPAGITSVWGSTYGANLNPVHPTESCFPRTSAFLARLASNGDLLQLTYLNISPDFVSGASMQYNLRGAALLFGASVLDSPADWEILQLGLAASEIALSCMGNGASFTNRWLSPNEIVSLFGAGLGPAQAVIAQPDTNGIYPFQLGGTQVTFDGVGAPLLYASGGQINLVTPHSLQGKTTTHVCASVNNSPTNCLDMQVQPAEPGLFLSSPVYAAALNQDGTVNSPQNPAPAGSVVSLFATGLGSTTPALPDGAITPYPPLPAQQPGIQVVATWLALFNSFGSVFPNVLYAGPAPLEVEGLAQINFVLPSSSPALAAGGPEFQIQVVLPDGKTLLLSNPVEIWTK